MAANPYEQVQAYGKNQKAAPAQSAGSRETDSRALLTCASRLNDAKILMEENQKSKENYKLYGDAIRYNQRLWTIFQVALSDPENPLPNDLKITLMNLSRYVDKTSFEAVAKYKPQLVDSLININRIIANGLSKQTAPDALQAPPSTREVPTALMTSA